MQFVYFLHFSFPDICIQRGAKVNPNDAKASAEDAKAAAEALDTDITKFVYNVGKTKFTNYSKNILKINIYARKMERKHLRVHSKLDFVV